jgi:hypothetical protein
MSHRKFLFLNKDNNEVGLILDLNDSDQVNAALIAGLLSNHEFIEVATEDESGLGWTWDGQKTVAPEWVE